MSRGKHTEAEMIAALKQLEAGRKAEDVAREVGVSKHTIYAWKAKYGGMEVSEAQEVKQLREENGRLKKLVADLSLDACQLFCGERRDYDTMTILEAGMRVKKMAAGSFKARCLKVMDEVQSRRETVVITKRGKPVAKLVPVPKECDEIFGFLAGKGKVVGDIVSPILSPKDWGSLY